MISMTPVWKAARELVELAGNEIVFIGGVAVYLHAKRRRASKLSPEVTHDIDTALSLVANDTVRHEFQVVTNPRLQKSQTTINGIEVDMYVEYRSGLRFDYQELAQYAVKAGKFNIASLGHLLLLKVAALRDRHASSKGAKDRRDVAKLLVLLADTSQDQRDLILGNATAADMAMIEHVIGSTAFMDIAQRNAKTAATLRTRAQRAVDQIWG
jgi:hypothetical protein